MALVAYLQAATAGAWALTGGCPSSAGRTALAAGRRDLALEVFAAANHPRPSAELPGRANLQLTGQPPPRRHSAQSSRPAGPRCRGTLAIPAQLVVS